MVNGGEDCLVRVFFSGLKMADLHLTALGHAPRLNDAQPKAHTCIWLCRKIWGDLILRNVEMYLVLTTENCGGT